MIRRSLLIASLVAAVSFMGSSARAAFTIVATETDSGTDSTGISFTTNPFAGPTPTPFPLSYNFLNINYSGTTGAAVTTGTISVTTSLLITNNGISTTTSTTDTFTYNFSAGVGSLTPLTTPTIGATDGLTFTATQFASPSLQGGQASMGNLSTMITAAAVPEPASMAMLGLGLAGVGFVVKRRRAV